MSRSAKKGPYVDEKLYRKVAKLNENRAKQPVKTWARSCTIIPEFVGHTFEVQAGRVFPDADVPRSQWTQTDDTRSGGAGITKRITMPYQAKHRYARIAPRKARLLMNLIRGRDVDDAITQLRFAKQRSSGMIEKVVRSAVANANETDTPPRNTLYVAKAWVDPGPIIKRFQPKDRGKAYEIKKRTSHLVVTLDEREKA
jgi:large subunit ribosomal protein L22